VAIPLLQILLQIANKEHSEFDRKRDRGNPSRAPPAALASWSEDKEPARQAFVSRH
jgi:hypothetical protein